MSMKKCKECGEEISSSAKKCPKCGKDQRNFFMKHPVIYTILILIVVSAITSGSGEETAPTSKTTLSTDNTSISQTGKNTGDVSVENSSKTTYNVGEIFENDYIAVKYVSMDDDFKGYSRYADIKANHKIVKLEFEFENVSDTDQIISDYNFNCYADGYDCEKFYMVSDDYYGLSADLSTGKKRKGSIYFQVPKEATTIVVEYEADYWSNQKVEFIVK